MQAECLDVFNLNGLTEDKGIFNIFESIFEVIEKYDLKE